MCDFFAVDYKRGEDPRLKITNTYRSNANANGVTIALSPNSHVIVVGTMNSLAFYSTLDGKLDNVIDNVYAGREGGVWNLVRINTFFLR